MDEIICTECGRPNLPEAVKCWYCQHPLEKLSDNQPLDTAAGENVKENNSGEQSEVIETQLDENDIPDWLKRVRERVKSDQDIDEEEKWKQERFFSQPEGEEATQSKDSDGRSVKQKPKKKKKKRRVAEPGQEKLIGKPAKKPDRLNSKKETDGIEETNLPEGYIQLPSEDE